MAVEILLTVIVTSIIQSIFGVGVLLFGTPLLLLLNYEFIEVLTILLPVSIAINCLQIIKHYQYIAIDFYKNVLIYTIPLVVLFLLAVSHFDINIGLLIGGFLILVALKNFSPVAENILASLVRYEKSYLMAMGLIHGLTNLGGSLLTAIVHAKAYPDKDVTRATIAICYATFAIFQIITLFFIGEYTISISENSVFLQIGVIVFLLTEEIVYRKIDNQKYSKLFALFLLISGIVLLIKSL